MATNLTVCCKYSVFKVWNTAGYVWSPDGERTQNTCGTHVSFAVRVLGLVDGLVTCANFYGEILSIPMHAFGARIPDTRFLPGAGILINGKPYSVEEAYDERVEIDGGVVTESYLVRTGRGPRTVLCRTATTWIFGSRKRTVSVRKAA